MSLREASLNALNKYLTNVKPRRYDALENVPEGLNVVKIQDRYYPEERVMKIGEQLTTPRVLQVKSHELFPTPFMVMETENLKGYVVKEPSGAAEVDFKTLVKNRENDLLSGWEFRSPDELNRSKPSQPYYTDAGIKDLRQFQQAFNSLSNSNQGAGLYANTPVGGLGGTRASIYRRQGFIDTPSGNQYLDRRRFSDSSAVQDVLAYRDSNTIGQEASVLHPDFNNRVAAMKVQPQIQPPIEPVLKYAPQYAAIPVTSTEWGYSMQ